MKYINKVKYRHGIGLPKTCGYQYCIEKTGYNDRDMFSQSYFALPLRNYIFHHFFAWTFYHFTCLPIMGVYISRITNHDYDKYFSIYEWGKSGGTCDAKVK